jgi:hypothetical protein
MAAKSSGAGSPSSPFFVRALRWLRQLLLSGHTAFLPLLLLGEIALNALIIRFVPCKLLCDSFWSG